MPDHRTPEQDDLLVQNGVLSLLLQEHPTLITMREVVAEVGSKRAAKDAVQALTAIGLLRREGESVLLTRAALHFHKLSA
jgi:hypothetical protein